MKELLIIVPAIFICLLKISHVEMKNNNQARNYCAIKKVKALNIFEGKERFHKEIIGLKCDIKNSDFTFDLESYNSIENKIIEYQKKTKFNYVEFIWPSKIKESSRLTKQFNISAFSKLSRHFRGAQSFVNFDNLNSIELNLFDEPIVNLTSQIFLMNSDLIFTIDGKSVKTCADITLARNGTFKIASLFQMPFKDKQRFYLFGCRFPKTICPLVFEGSLIQYFYIFGLSNTFYKTNLMKISNETFNNLDSNILELFIYHSENIALETSFINPSVFEEIIYILIESSISSISVDLFESL